MAHTFQSGPLDVGSRAHPALSCCGTNPSFLGISQSDRGRFRRDRHALQLYYNSTPVNPLSFRAQLATGLATRTSRAGERSVSRPTVAKHMAATLFFGLRLISLAHPRRPASIFAVSIFFISIIDSKARLASAPPAAIALVRARGVICHDSPQRSLHQPQALSWPPLPTIAFQ